MLSRQTCSGWEMALNANELAGSAASYRELIDKEIAILRGIALAHPLKADKIKNLIERYQGLARHISAARP